MVQSVQTSNNYIDLLLVRNEKKNIVKPKNSRNYNSVILLPINHHPYFNSLWDSIELSKKF